MKFNVMSAAVVLLGLTAWTPDAVRAQAFGVHPNPCCNVCRQQVCCCSTTRPVVETRLRRQDCLTYQDRKRVVCKTEPVCVTVPVTKVDCVTVDEGCYQMVWVPKPVTKAIPRTELHQRMTTRQVPVEICEKVPVMTSRLVPEQTIRYVTEHRTVTTTPPVPLCPPAPCPPAGPACPPGFGVGGVGVGVGPAGVGVGAGVPGIAPGLRPGFAPGGPSPVAVPYSVMNQRPTSASVASTTVQTPATAGLVPDARYAEPRATWTNVPSRNAATPTQKYAESQATRSISGMMVKAPTASMIRIRRQAP